MKTSFTHNTRTLEITCKAGGQPSRNSIRRQRQRRQPPLLPFERKLEEQRERQLQLNLDDGELSKSPIGFLEESTRRQPTTTSVPHENESLDTVQTVQAEVINEVDEKNEIEVVGGDGVVAQQQILEVEEEEEETAEERLRREITRKAQALMEIMQAGAGVEEAISRHSADIDDTMMELLQRRMEAARHLERQSEIVKGMEMLQRRLKAEIDRKKASLSMRLLDSVLNILDGGDEEEGTETSGARGGGKSRSAEVQKAARARLQSAFGAAPLEADVMFLATQLALRGQSIADELLEERVDGNVFIKEVTALLEGAMEQQQQLKIAVEHLDPKGPERAKVQEIINERAADLGLVQEVLVLARSCMKPEL